MSRITISGLAIHDNFCISQTQDQYTLITGSIILYSSKILSVTTVTLYELL